MAIPRRRRCAAGNGYESTRPARHARPVDHLPGSAAKIEAMAQRCARRQALHSPGDLIDVDGLRLRLTRAGNGTLVKDQGQDGDVIDEREKSEKNSERNLRKLSAPTPGDRIKAARLKRGLSAKRASLLMGLSESTLGKVERREVAPCLWMIYLVSQHLGVDPDWLCCIEVDESGNVRCLCA